MLTDAHKMQVICRRYTMIQFLAVIYFYETLIISFLIECLDVQ